MKRVKPKKLKKEQKQVHFEMNLEDYFKFEEEVYAMGYSISDFFREKAADLIKYRQNVK